MRTKPGEGRRAGFAATAMGALVVLACSAPLAKAEPNPPSSSQIIKLYETKTETIVKDSARSTKKINLSGYRRPDFIGPVYEGNFGRAPAHSLDNLRYFAQTLADLDKQCPALQLESVHARVVPYVLSSSLDLFQRFQRAELSPSEILQATWMAVAGLSATGPCSYDPNDLGLSSGALRDAEARCDRAASDAQDVLLMPSSDAKADVATLVKRHGCGGVETKRFASQLIEFGTMAHARTGNEGWLPPPDTAEGKAYVDIIESCSRRSLQPADDAWCKCYATTLYKLKPEMSTLDALAKNPFVDASSYLYWLVGKYQGGSALTQCERVYRGVYDWRENRAPRPTACLLGEERREGGKRECRFAAAFGEFTVLAPTCPVEITSQQWGFREVDCAKGGKIVSPSNAPRVWEAGIYHMIDYEAPVSDGFVPPLPPNSLALAPLQIRMLAVKEPGRLQRLALHGLAPADLGHMITPQDSDAVFAALSAIDRNAMVLTCQYKAKEGALRHTYWFGERPAEAAPERLNPVAVRYFESIMPPVSTCPAFKHE